jgi:8-oxoguanine deaminase
VVIPGLVNTHNHLYQTLTRAFPPALNKRLFPCLQTLYPVWARLQPDMLHAATELGLAELMLSGFTTVAGIWKVEQGILTTSDINEIQVRHKASALLLVNE